MAEETSVSKRRGKIICQDGELDFDDPAVEEGFADLKAAILTGRTDIVRIILSAAQSYRDEEETFSEDEEEDENQPKTDEQEVLDLLQMLLNFRDNDAGTSLHYATKLDQTDIARSLLAVGANPTLRNLENATAYDYCRSDQMKTAYVGALMQAVAQSKAYRVKLLLQAGVDVNAGDGAESDNKILHWAASFADSGIVGLIIESGADVNATNADGASALHDAIVRGDEEVIVELLNHGAKIDIVPFKGPMEGKSCYDLTDSKSESRDLLERHLGISNNISEEASNDDKAETSSTLSSISSLPQLPTLLSPLSNSTSTKLVNGEHLSIEDNHLPPSSTNATFKPILLPPKSPMKLFFPTLVQLDPGVSQLWPPPQKILQYKGTFYVPALNLVFVLISSRNMTAACVAELVDIIQVMRPKYEITGFNLQTDLTASYSTNYSCPKGSVECFIDPSTFHHCDEYRLHISTRKVKIVASGAKAVFYALNTFLQCLRIFQGKGLPLWQISDWPEMSIRGVQVDYHEGDLPKLNSFLRFIDDISGFKVNQLHLPAEIFLPDDQNRNIFYTRSDLLRIHKFCSERYIEVVPVLRSSDVLGNFNTLSYASIKSDILPLFPSTRYLNLSLNCNESFSKAHRHLLTGIIDNDLVRRIEELHEFCVSNGLTLLLDSEMILKQPVKLLDINNNLICLNMSEESKQAAISEYLYDLGIPHVVSPPYKDVDTILNDARANLEKFERSTHVARSNGALGMIIRYEAKPCICCFSLDIASLAVGAAMIWKSSPAVVADDAMLMGILNRHVYLDDNDIIGDLLLTLSSIEQIELLGKRDSEKETEKGNISTPCFLKSLLTSSDNLNCYPVSLENLKITTVSLKQLESRIGKCKLKCEAKDMVINEVTFLIKILLFLCRVGVTLQKSKKVGEEISLSTLTEIQRSDLSNKLMSITEHYESFCCSHYNETPRGLKSVELLKKLLANLYPERKSSFLNSLSRTFTV